MWYYGDCPVVCLWRCGSLKKLSLYIFFGIGKLFTVADNAKASDCPLFLIEISTIFYFFISSTIDPAVFLLKRKTHEIPRDSLQLAAELGLSVVSIYYHSPRSLAVVKCPLQHRPAFNRWWQSTRIRPFVSGAICLSEVGSSSCKTMPSITTRWCYRLSWLNSWSSTFKGTWLKRGCDAFDCVVFELGFVYPC